MKKIIYFSLAAFLFILGSSEFQSVCGVNSGNTQLNSETPDRTISHRFQSGYWTPITCDGVTFDYLEGVLDVHCVMFGHAGAWQWMTMRFTGTLTNSEGEHFKIKEIDKSDATEFSWHANIVGDMGSHYVISGTGTFDPYTFTIDQVVCPNGPKE